MKYLFFAAGVGLAVGLFALPSLAAEPQWDCPAGQEPITYLEDQPSGEACGTPTAACLRTGAPSSMYLFLCPARSNKTPRQCPAGQRLQVLPSDDSPRIVCGDPWPGCVPLDPPRNTIFDCREQTSPASTYAAQPTSPLLKRSPLPVVETEPFDDLAPIAEEVPGRQNFWQRLLDAIARLFGF